MPIEIIDKLKQKNSGTFKLIDAKDVEMENGQDLEAFLKDGVTTKGGGYYIGPTPPEDTTLLWVDTTDESIDDTLDSIIINELKASISSLQNKVTQLEADVEYLKLYGGGTTNPGTEFSVLTEAGEIITCENGDFIVLEDYA